MTDMTRQHDEPGRDPHGFRRLSHGLRHLLRERATMEPGAWRRELSRVLRDGREARLQPEHVLVALKSEWAAIRGRRVSNPDAEELNRLVTLCIDCYYGDGAPRTDGGDPGLGGGDGAGAGTPRDPERELGA